MSLLVARTEGNGELQVPGGDWEVDCRQTVCVNVFGGSTSATDTTPLGVVKWDLSMDYEGQNWRQKVGTSKAVSGLPPPSLISKPSALLDSYDCSVQVCWLAGVRNFRFGDLPQAEVFFQGHQTALGAVNPIFAGLDHCEHRKIQLSCQWRSDRRSWRESKYWRTVRFSSEWRLNQIPVLNSKKFSSAKNFVKSDRQAVSQEFFFVKRRVARFVFGRSVRLLIVYLHIHDYFWSHTCRFEENLVRNLI